MRGRERDDSENKSEYRRLQCGQWEAIYLCIGLRNLRFRNHLLLWKVLIECLKEFANFIHDSGLIRNECQNVENYFLGDLIIFGTIFF